VSVVANVAINVDASKATEQLRQFQRQTQTAARAVENIKVDALNQALNTLPGGLGVAVNGINGFVRKINEAGAASKAATAEIVALQTALASKKLQLAGRGGIGGEAIKAEIKQIESSLASLQGAAKGVSPALLVAGGGVIALTAGLVAMAGASLKFSNEIDRNRQQLTLFTKNVEATNAIIADLKTTADATSLGLPGLLEATKTLAAYGVSAKNAGIATKLLGDLALGDNEKLQRFAVNLGQISSIGRAYTVDLKQFAMAGIPIFEALAKVMGTSTGEVLRLAEQGKVTYPIVIKAINELTKEGASFFNGAERGGTNLDRSLAQLQGSFESLQVVIGNAVGPIAVTGVNTLKTALDGLLTIVEKTSKAFQYLGTVMPSAGPLDIFVKDAKKSFDDLLAYMEKNSPALKIFFGGENEFVEAMKGFAVGGPIGALKSVGGAQANQKENNKGAQVQKLLDEANTIARKNAETELANLRIENDKKIAKLNKNTELQLKDNRFQYEQQIADFRESTIRRIADMERTLQDQRIKANFDLQQSQLKLAGKAQYGKDTSAMITAAATGQDTTMLSAARDSAKSLNDAAVTRRQIEFDSTMKKIQLERTLTDFKKGIEREIGEMQKSYARQVDGILRTAGRSLGDLMVEGAKKAKAIMESIKPTVGAGDKIGPSVSSGIIARTGSTGDSTGPHLDIRWADGRPITKADADKYFSLNGKSPSSYGVTSGYGPRSLFGRSFHAGMDFGTPSGTPISLKGGAALTKNLGNTGAGGYAAEISTPQGPMRILHLLANSIAKIPAAAKTGPAAAALQAPAGSRAMQVDAANSIKPYSPATAKLDQETNALKNQETQAKINQILDQQVTKTNELKDATFQVTEQSMAGLKTSIEKSQADQRTLDLIVSGTNPALAAQFAQNEQLNAQNTLKLEAQQASVQKTLEEKGLTAETVFERQNLVSQLDEQIARQPQILEGLNQQAVKQKEINDATARRSVIPNFIASAQTQLKDLESVAVRVSQGIGDAVGNSLTKGVQGLIEGTATAQQVFADFLKTVGDILMQEGAKMIATYTAIAIARSLAGLFGGGGGGGGAQGFQMPEIAPGVGSLGPQKIFGFAAGGNPPVGKASLVGEKGPELFVPSAAGTIIPAGPTAGIREVMANGNGGNATAPILNMSFETTRFGNTDYVSREQLEAAMMQTRAEATKAGARRGMTMTLDKLQQSPSTRSRVGLG